MQMLGAEASDRLRDVGLLNDLGYRFSLGHFTVHHGETVLFAWCDDGET